MSRYALWICCLVSLLAIAPAVRGSASPQSGGPLLSVVVTSTSVHPGDYVSLSVSSVASWNGTRTNYSRGPIRITAVDSTGANVSPLAGQHELLNGTFGIGWVVGNGSIDFIGITVQDLETGLVQRLELDVSLTLRQVADLMGKNLSRFEAGQAAANAQDRADMWFLFYVMSLVIVALSTAVCIAVENAIAHKQNPPRESVWDRVKGWVRISREPIPDVIDMAFTDREHVFGDVPLKAQLDVLAHREEYLNWLHARDLDTMREIRALPKTKQELKDRFVKMRRELGLDADWET